MSLIGTVPESERMLHKETMTARAKAMEVTDAYCLCSFQPIKCTLSSSVSQAQAFSSARSLKDYYGALAAHISELNEKFPGIVS
jgi:hypothetical protein